MTSNENYWEFVKDTNNKYLVSRDGDVVSLNFNGTNEIKKLSQYKSKQGYMFVKIQFGKVSKRILVHRLVAEAFIPNPNNYPEINHKNGIKNENNVINLEWCNRSQNVKHAYKTGLKSPPKQSGFCIPSPVDMYDLNMNYIMSFDSYSDCCKYLNEKYNYNSKPSYISRVVLGQRKRYKDFTFRKSKL